MPVSEILEIARQVTEGLEYAHGAGIVHRDLKPGNVMLLPDGTIKILDFGLARAADQGLSEPGARFGTVSYMAPEQILGEAADRRADLWATGVVLYEMLTQRKPFGGEHGISIAHAILHDEPVPPSAHRGDLSAALEDLVLRLLRKDPARRYATASELLGELARIDTAVQGTIESPRTRRRHAGRYANAGEFAHAPETTRLPQRPSARSRRWVLMPIGAAVATVAAILILARNPAPPPAPDRLQLTFTGNALAASLSPDGERLAFAEKQCDEAGSCTHQVVIQDTDGSNRLVVSRNATRVFRTAWTSDGRYLAFDASYGPARWGVFVVSTLGGTPRHLGPGRYDLLGGDTVLVTAVLSPGDSIGWVRRMTAHDGRTLDSIPVHAPGTLTPGYGFDVTRLTYPDRLIVTVRETFESAPEFRLVDFRGGIIDRVTPGFASLGRLVWSSWVPSRQKLIVASERQLYSLELDILSMDVTASGIDADVDTVLSGLQTSDGVFRISPDGERLVHSPGSVETTVWAIDTRRTEEGRFAATRVLSSTTLLRGVISPAGDRIFVVREMPTSEGRVSDFSILPRDGGAERRIARGIRDLLDFEWSPDGATIMYLHGIGGNEVRLMETDTMGRRTREIARFGQSAAIAFHPLPDGALCIIPPERRSLSIIRRHGKRDVTWRAPDWISNIVSVSLSPDARSLAVQGWDQAGDSIVVATMDIEDGRSTRLGILGGEWPGGIRWLEDGNIMFDFRETEGSYALFTTRPGGATRRLGALPYTQEISSVSKDGIHMAGFSSTIKNDVYMIRNFGKLLGR
jgi:Tol biopolymer transport system component